MELQQCDRTEITSTEMINYDHKPAYYHSTKSDHSTSMYKRNLEIEVQNLEILVVNSTGGQKDYNVNQVQEKIFSLARC